jgi:hypothetical protein
MRIVKDMGQDFSLRDNELEYKLVPMCPLCRGDIYWTMHNSAVGSRAGAYCSNNPNATRIILNPAHIVSCLWEGMVVRNKAGSVDLFSKDGHMVPYRVVKGAKLRR